MRGNMLPVVLTQAVVLTLAVVPTLAIALGAQEPAATRPGQPATTPRILADARGFVLPAGELDLRELIDAAAAFLQRHILAPADELARTDRAPLVLQKALELDALGCEEVVSQLLHVRGFALVAIDAERGLWEVIALDGPRQSDIVQAAPQRGTDEILRRPHLKQYVVTELRLQHVDASAVVSALRPFFAQSVRGANSPNSVTFGTAGTSASLLIGGFQDQVAQAIRLVAACDVPVAVGTAAGAAPEPVSAAPKQQAR